MKRLNVWLWGLTVGGLLYSCSKKDSVTAVTDPVVKVYNVSEDFEGGQKTAYKIADVKLYTGSWSFDDALIGNLAADAKDGSQSVRLRTGNITTNFQISNLKKIFVSHAKYGNDGTSTWQLMISVDSFKTSTQLGTSVMDTSTTLRIDSFVNTIKSPVQVRIVKSGTTRINLDNIIFVGEGESGIVFNTNLDSLSNSYDTITPPRYAVFGSDAQPNSGDNSNLLMGNPSKADSILSLATNYLMNQHYYIESYNSNRGTPNWVSWHIDASNITGAASRQDNFAGYAGFPTDWFTVQSNSYFNSGYSRGHNCPSADRTSSLNANAATFLMTNMIPQTSSNNEGVWNNFEVYIRDQVRAGYEAYVIMGSYGNAGTIASGHVTVPTNIWKVVLLLPNGDNDLNRVDVNTKIIAINTPNTSNVSQNWQDFIVSVDDIENATGYDLFTSLSSTLQASLEAKKFQ